ncbi:MAG: nucleotidyltransferase domain-containing protein [Nitrososphaeria archaeon]|nr:nucleotidyltransferase domain-containing protein [Nitrososphaeria archaeon]
MLENFLVDEAKKKLEFFRNIDYYLKKIKQILRTIDPEGRVFLFGSTGRGENVLASDIDVLILTELAPSSVIATLRKEGFDEIFEFHVVDSRRFKIYCNYVKDLKEV